MFENSENQNSHKSSQCPPRAFGICSTNLPLKGNLKQLGKYEFSFDQKLGSGLTSDAYFGIDKQNQKPVCVKIIDREIFKNETQKALLSNEIKCQQKLESDFIIGIYDVYDTNSFCFVITELCEDGDLFKLIQYSRFGLPERLVIRLAKNLAQALLTMKQNKIIHRDIKSENILLTHGIAKLGDFGFAIEEKNLQEREQFSIGSPLYMPLQALQENKYSYESDIFSFGIVLYEMLHARSPWECSEQKQLIIKMKSEPLYFKQGISSKLQSIISSCLQLQAVDRAKIEKVFQQIESLDRGYCENMEKGPEKTQMGKAQKENNQCK